VLLLVAHPDDETLFAGGLMLAHPSWEWHVVCMTGVQERRAQFDTAMECFRREGVNIASTRNHEFEDRYRPADRRLWLAALAKEDTSSWDIVFTHGYRGEYGHHHHVWLNLIAHLLYVNVWDFWQPEVERLPQLLKTLTVAIPSDSRKAAIFTHAYGDIAAGLRENAPWVTEPMYSGSPEFFTQGILGL
jgi:LmbE family N-acetylglucosaminyl deacetylase